MKEHRRSVLVGVFMVAGVGTLGLLMVMFGEAPEWLGGAEWPLEIHVTRLRGAPQGTAVKMNGIQIGRVDKLKFDDPARPDLGVSIIALVKNQYGVPQGAKAVIYEPVLGVGRGRIEITVPPDGGGPLLPTEGARIRGEMGSMIHEIVPDTMMSSVERAVLQIGDFAGALTPVADDLHKMFQMRPMNLVDDPGQARRLTANLSTVIQRLDQTLKHFNLVLGDPNVQSALRESVENLHQLTEDGKTALADFRETAATLKDGTARITVKFEQGVDQAAANVDRLSRRAFPILDDMAEATSNLNRASLDLAEGKGSAGKFLRDDRLYESLVLFVERFTGLVNTVRRIADKTERQGYLDLGVHNTGVPGTAPARKRLFDPAAVSSAER